jgi:N6-adenosine-specific RNA methylase IME4
MTEDRLATLDPSTGRILAPVDVVGRILAESTSVGQVKDLRDRAQALTAYARRRGESLASQNYYAEIKLRLERGIGNMTAEIPRERGFAHSAHDGHNDTPLQEAAIEHHLQRRCEQIAYIPVEKFDQYIEGQRETGEVTTAGALAIARVLKRAELRTETSALAQEIEPISGQFRTIVIDPPWAAPDSHDDDPIGRGNPNYASMTLEEIADLHIADYALPDDCHLYLWVTNRMLPKAYSLLDSWGFRYITTLTWCKNGIGVGRYYRNNTEHVIFAMTGTRLLGRADMGTWFATDREGPHSTKPGEFYRIVEECSPGPRLEMFARGPRDGWTVWGAEANG